MVGLPRPGGVQVARVPAQVEFGGQGPYFPHATPKPFGVWLGSMPLGVPYTPLKSGEEIKIA